MPVTATLAERLHQRAAANRWQVSVEEFTAVLERCAAKVDAAQPAALSRALEALHLGDLALATACAQGHEAAWEHFVREHRPLLYRAGMAIAGEFGRELADSLYAELFGLRERDGNRQSLFRYFHGRSSLGTWLRSILAQRYVDEVRSRRRLDPLPDEEDPSSPVAGASGPDPEAERQAGLVRDTLGAAIARLSPRDRLRLAWYLSARHDARPDRPPLPGARGHRLPSPHPDQEGAAGRHRGPAPARGARCPRDRRMLRGGCGGSR